MPYTYPIDAQAMFDDRTHQFVGLGLPAGDVARVRAATTDFWADAPGGWVYEFSQLAAGYAAAGNPLLASLAYGCAKFPCLADEARRTALAHQLEQYELAAPSFPVRFERRTLDLTVGEATIGLPVHLYTAAGTPTAAPVLLLGGGVDTWKMDFHQWCVLFAQRAGVTVLAFDMPGTGENPVPLGPDADALVQGLVVAARGVGNGLVAHLGISFGGNFSALTGLTGTVDAAVVLGGPVDGAFEPANLRRLPYGMADIVGNAMGFDHPVTVDELSKAGAALNRAALLATAQNSPMLVVNGADDYFVPQQDTLVFDGRPGVTVELIPGTGHCAMSKAAQVLPRVIGWLRNQLGVITPPTVTDPADPTAAPVLVVGAGPVGLVLACELARRDVPVRVIDKLPAPTVESRAILIHSRSLEMLARIGVVDEIIASGVRTEGMQMHADGRLLADLTVDGVDSPYPFSITTAQTETERILADRLTALGGSIERGVELVSFEQDDTAVTYRLTHPDGTAETATTGWIVGTDGSHSTVRAQTGQKLVGSFKGERFLLGDVDVDVDVDELPRDRMHSFFGTGGGPLLLFPMLGRRMRVIAQITDGNDDATVERLQQVLDDRRVPAQVGAARWLTVFEIHHAQVPQYRVGRAFLAGDAAHVHSPAGGQGMNTGMQDAFNLGWKLAAVVAGDADPALLDSYQTERHPVAARVIEQTTRITNLGTMDNRLARTLRNTVVHLATRLPAVRRTVAEQLAETDLSYRSSPLVAGRGGSGGLRPGDCAPAVAGTRLWPLLVDGTDPAGGATGTLALVFGPPAADDEAGSAVLAGLRRIRVAAAPVTGAAEPGDHAGDAVGDGRDTDGAVLDDPDGRIAHRYGARPGDVVLVRPDGYVGFVGALADSAAIARYRASAGCPARGGSTAVGTTSASVNDTPSPVAAATSAGVS